MVRRTKEDALATRSALLDAAECVFQQRGVAGTSLGDIARAAGLTRGAIYWHFENKVVLFDAMVERLVCPLLINCEDRNERMQADPLGFIYNALDQFISLMLNDAKFRRVFEILWHKCEYVGEMANIRDSHLDEGENHIDVLQQAFSLAIAQGQLHSALTPHQATIGLVAVIDGLLFNWTKNPALFPLDSYASPIIRAYLNGLTRPQA